MANQQDHANNLKISRAGTLKNSVQQTKKGAKAAMSGISLMGQINPFVDWLFAIALMAAMLKDILDIVNTALIAAGGIGAALIFIFTLMTSAIIAVVMILTGASGKAKAARKIAKRIMILVTATLVELIPGVDILPLETVVVIVIFWLTLVERKMGSAQEKETAQNMQTQTD
jgi:hypothetical protein